MVPPIVNSIPKLFPTLGSYAVGREIQDGNRIVDVMCALFPENADMSQVSEALGNLSVSETIVLGYILEKKKVSTGTLCNLTYLSRSKMEEEYLARLDRLGLIHKEKKSWCVGEWSSVYPEQTIAIEAKLFNWREAISQACDNQARADKSYIALPCDNGKAIPKIIISEAKSFGIGVLAVNDNGSIHIAVDARQGSKKMCRKKVSLSLRMMSDIRKKKSRWTYEDKGANVAFQ